MRILFLLSSLAAIAIVGTALSQQQEFAVPYVYRAGDPVTRANLNANFQALSRELGALRAQVEEPRAQTSLVENSGLSRSLDHLNQRLVALTATVESLRGQASLPEGSLLLLDTPDCPPGWMPVEAYDGRFILLSSPEKPVRTQGGSSSVQLSVEQLPRHDHGVTDGGHTHTTPGIGFGDKRYSGGGGAAFGSGPTPATSTPAATGITIQEAGGGRPVPIEPPFVALKLCKIVRP